MQALSRPRTVDHHFGRTDDVDLLRAGNLVLALVLGVLRRPAFVSRPMQSIRCRLVRGNTN